MTKKTNRCRVPIVGVMLACALAASLLGAPARAQDAKAAAAEHAKQAQIAYDLSDYKTAAREYQAAYQAEQKPEFLWALAQAQRLGGECAVAIKTYKAYKRGDVSSTQATAAELQITKCEAELAKQEAERAAAPRSAEPAPAAPSPAPVRPAPSAASAATERPSPWYTDVFGHVLFFSGVGAATAGGVLLAIGNSDAGDTSGTYDEALARRDGTRQKQVVGVGGILLGGTLMGVGVLRFALLAGSVAPVRKTQGLVVSGSTDGASGLVRLGGSF